MDCPSRHEYAAVMFTHGGRMKAHRDQFEIRKQLASFGDDQVIDANEFAAFRGISVEALYRLLYLRSDAIPPPLAGLGRRRLWRLGTCREWLRKLQVASVGSHPQENAGPRTGRPRKP